MLDVSKECEEHGVKGWRHHLEGSISCSRNVNRLRAICILPARYQSSKEDVFEHMIYSCQSLLIILENGSVSLSERHIAIISRTFERVDPRESTHLSFAC